MLYRLVYGTTAALALLTVVAADAYLADAAAERAAPATLVRHGSIIPLAFTAVIALGAIELGRLLRVSGHRPSVAWATLSCAVLMLSPWLCAGGVLGDHPVDVEGLHWQVIWIAVAVLGTVVVHLCRGGSATALTDVAATLLIVLYVGFLPSFAIQLRCDADIGDPIAGAWTLLVVLAVVFASDITALYVGRALGRHKLVPSISPGKTVEGFVGGVAGSVAAALMIWGAGFLPVPEEEPTTALERLAVLAGDMTIGISRLTFTQVILFGMAMAVTAQIGDLFESLIKRSAQVKDSSSLIPGMGGVLDVIDGAVFAVPLAWYLLTRTWHVV